MAQLGTQTPEQLTQLNTHLATNNYVNGDLPGADDVRIFDALKTLPDRSTHNEVHFWYLIIQAFAPQIRAQWAGQVQKEEKPQLQQAAKPVEKKAEEEVDLFGDDDEETTAEAKKLAEEKKRAALDAAGPPKKVKKAVVAKTIIIFDVKVYEAEDSELLERIAKKIRDEINPEGLVWAKEHKLELVAYGAKKLKMTMIVEDDKVTSDDVFDIILSWEDDVQSVDVDTMQKV